MSRIAPPKAVESSPISQRYESSGGADPPRSFRLTLTALPAASSFLITPPFAVEMLSVGIVIGVVIVGSSAMPKGPPPTALFAMTTPIAPASCAFLVFVLNVQTPRSTSAILPATAAAFVSAAQPVVAVPTRARTAFSVVPAPVTGGPKAAAPAAQIRAIDAGELI